MDTLRPWAAFLQPRALEEEQKMVGLTQGWGFAGSIQWMVSGTGMKGTLA